MFERELFRSSKQSGEIDSLFKTHIFSRVSLKFVTKMGKTYQMYIESRDN